MELELQHVDESGNGYAVVYMEDGSSWGLRFRGLPIEDDAAFAAALMEAVSAQVAQTTPPPAKVMDPKILERIGVKKPKDAKNPKEG